MKPDPHDYVDCLTPFCRGTWLHPVNWTALPRKDIPPELVSLAKDITAQAFALHKVKHPVARQSRGAVYVAGVNTTASIVAHVLTNGHLSDDYAVQIDTAGSYRSILSNNITYSVSTADKRLHALRALGLCTVTTKYSAGSYAVDDVRPTDALRKLAVKHDISLDPINKAIDAAREKQMGVVKVKVSTPV